jgi:hypothetical protein
MKGPKETMRELLQHLKKAEKELDAALSLFAKFPSGKSKNGAKRMDRLIDALHLLQAFQFDLPRDWEQSHWFRPEEHQEFLRNLEQELRESDLADLAR